MTATTGQQAGVETNGTQFSAGFEATWGTAPATTFSATRFMSETLSLQKTRARPQEIGTTREVFQAVTLTEEARGTLTSPMFFSLNAGLAMYMASVLNNDPTSILTISSATSDLSIVAGSPATLVTTTSSKLSPLTPGQFIRLRGWANAANNGVWYVSAQADGQHASIVSARTAVNETYGADGVAVRYGATVNGTNFKSLFIQNMLSSSLWLRYPGSYATRAVLQGSVGNYLTIAFDILAQQEVSASSDASTGGVVAAATGAVLDPASSFGGFLWNGAPISAGIDQFSLTLENVGAACEYQMGQNIAAGMLPGTFQATATVRAYFKTFAEYTIFTNETQGNASFITGDNAGNAFVFSLLNAGISAVPIDAAGPGQPVYATLSIEGNPLATGGTASWTRLPA